MESKSEFPIMSQDDGYGPSQDTPLLYRDLAAWWPLMSAPASYAEEADFYRKALEATCSLSSRSMLELGSGGGNNASHLKRHFRMTLTDVAPGMLEVSKSLNDECEHVQGDMRTIRLGRQFAYVLVHDAVCYMTTQQDLRRAMETAFVHCEPGGAALFAPDHIRENFRPSTESGGHDGDERSLRYLEWTTDPDPMDETYVVDYAYLLRDIDGTVQVKKDRHVEGLFSRADWLRLLTDVGFEPNVVACEHSELPNVESEVFVGKKRQPDTTS